MRDGRARGLQKSRSTIKIARSFALQVDGTTDL